MSHTHKDICSRCVSFVIEVDNEKIIAEFDLANSTGFKVGGGILLKNKTSIEINYLGLGKHDIEGRMKYDGGLDDLEAEQKVTILTLTIGFRL